jgi:Putative metal-binding motif
MLAVLAVAATMAASVTYDLNVKVTDEQGRLAGSLTGTLRYDSPDHYRAHMCVKDEFKDGREPFVKLEYLYTDGATHTTRSWGETTGAGTESCHDAWVTWPPAIDGIAAVLDLTGLQTPARSWYDNPYAAKPAPVDADGDGFFAGQDCDDANPAVRPGAAEVPGNGIDENCDGTDPPLERIASGVSTQWIVRGRRVTLARMRVRDVPAGGTAELRCRGRRCPVRRIRAKRPTVDLAKKVGRRRFHAGQTIEVRITAPGRIGKVVRYRLRPRRAPTGRPLCLPPGSAKPRRC